MRYRPRQVCLCDPNRLLSSLPRFSAHCHARSLLPTVVNHSTIYDENPDLHHGLLAEVFELYSRGWCFVSWSDICDFEVRQALRHAFERLVPTRPKVFGRGFMSTASAKGREILSK